MNVLTTKLPRLRTVYDAVKAQGLDVTPADRDRLNAVSDELDTLTTQLAAIDPDDQLLKSVQHEK